MMPGPLTERERDDVYACLVEDREMSWAEMGRRVGRHRSTMSREVVRNGGRWGYRPSAARERAERMRCRPKPLRLVVEADLRMRVIADLGAGFSPAAIVHRLPSGIGVSAETIYRAVYTGVLGLKPAECLRTRRPRRKPRQRQYWEQGHYLGEYTSIHQRPARVEDRVEAGHWEGDMIIGRYNQSAMITLIERVSRLTVLLQLPHGYGARAVIAVLVAWLETVPASMRLSITWDQGSEMSRWLALIGLIDAVYFCDPRSPWQRGCNEQNNRTLRFWLPRNTNLAVIDPEPIMAIINNQPRRRLGWATPNHVYQNQLSAH